jgi:hypothetical protein
MDSTAERDNSELFSLSGSASVELLSERLAANDFNAKSKEREILDGSSADAHDDKRSRCKSSYKLRILASETGGSSSAVETPQPM